MAAAKRHKETRILATLLGAISFAACAQTSPVLVSKNDCTFDLKRICSEYRPSASVAHARFLDDRDIGETDIQSGWTVPFESSGTEVSCTTERLTSSVADAKVTKGGTFNDQDIRQIREKGLCQ
jgi:hypothetical protein